MRPLAAYPLLTTNRFSRSENTPKPSRCSTAARAALPKESPYRPTTSAERYPTLAPAGEFALSVQHTRYRDRAEARKRLSAFLIRAGKSEVPAACKWDIMVWFLALASATHNARHLEHLVRVAPLVVVPGDDLDEGLVQRDAGVCIEH